MFDELELSSRDTFSTDILMRFFLCALHSTMGKKSMKIIINKSGENSHSLMESKESCDLFLNSIHRVVYFILFFLPHLVSLFHPRPIALAPS